MASPGEIINLGDLFERSFGSRPYVVTKDGDLSNSEGPLYRVDRPQAVNYYGELSTPKGSRIAQMYKGVQIWLPTTLYLATLPMTYLPYSVVKISGKKTIIRTPLPERVGTVKEQYNIDDYSITLKGFLIGDKLGAGGFPEEELDNLKRLYEAKSPVTIDNALTNIFLTNKEVGFFEQRRVVITRLELPEVQGGRKNIRPFVLEMESDSVFTLELK